ncbi:MAG: hypothetical protein U0R19_08120 [Bryobacteraceae bacterium]
MDLTVDFFAVEGDVFFFVVVAAKAWVNTMARRTRKIPMTVFGFMPPLFLYRYKSASTIDGMNANNRYFLQ